MQVRKGLGGDEKIFQLNSKALDFREIKFHHPEIFNFLTSYFSKSLSLEVHTSGSTGTPKPINILKENMRASAQKTITALQLNRGDTCLLCLPVNRIGGIMMLVRWLQADLDLYPVGDTSTPLKDSNSIYDFAAMVPFQVQQSLAELGRVKKLIIGGSPLSPELENKLKTMPNEIYHTYGMTETISHIALRRVNGNKAEGFFRALPGIEFETDDRDCLIIHAPAIGVSNLITNDVIELHSSTTFTWKGRADNVVNSGGIKLFPEEIEKKIGKVGFNYFLFGQPDEKLGERLVLLVESNDTLPLNYFKEHFIQLQKYERPKEILTVPVFRTSAGGKLDRKGSIDELNHKLL